LYGVCFGERGELTRIAYARRNNGMHLNEEL